MYSYTNIYKTPHGYQLGMQLYDKTLMDMNIPFESVMVNTRFGTTHVLSFGRRDALPVIWFPTPITGNFGLDTRQFIPFFAQHYRIISIDVIGTVGKSVPVRLPYNDPAYGVWLLEVFDALGIGNAAIVSELMGSWLTMKFATVAPQRIAKAVLINPTGMIPLQRRGSLGYWAKFMYYDALVRAFPNETNALNYFKCMATPGALISPALMQVEIEGLMFFLKHYNFPAIPPVLSVAEQRRLVAPTLLLLGEGNKVISPEVAIPHAQQTFPNLRGIEIIHRAGGMPTVEQPHWLQDRLFRFLQQKD